MFKWIVKILVNALAVYVTANILKGVSVDSFMTALIVAVVLGIINTFIKPVVLLLTLPINILSLGLFTFVINAAIIIFISNLIPGFQVDNVVRALLFSFLLSIVSSVLGIFIK